MNESNPLPRVPGAILMATDMSARCDRALARSAQLAEQWAAQLVVAHAIEAGPDFAASRRLLDLPSWRRTEDRAITVRSQLSADLAEEGITSSIVVEEAEPQEMVLRVAQQMDIELIVTGLARDEPWGRVFLGTTVTHLARKAECPLLVVRNRARAPYRRIVLATDFSEASRQALRAATQFFPTSNLSVFHAYDSPYSASPEAVAVRESWEALAREECVKFISDAGLPEETQRRLDLLVEHGHPGRLLRDLCQHGQVDLVVIGSRGRSIVQTLLLGSTAETLLRMVPCDIMVVRRAPA